MGGKLSYQFRIPPRRSRSLRLRNLHWRRPTPDYYIIYQLHPSRFTNRYEGDRPLRRIAKEIAESAGYFRELGVTAIQLLPLNEVSSAHSWGYDPAYFYAIENDYCGADGPDDLKHLIYTCHQHGLAVVLDVVFNHAGGDNILWDVARDSFFDGDTQWQARQFRSSPMPALLCTEPGVPGE